MRSAVRRMGMEGVVGGTVCSAHWLRGRRRKLERIDTGTCFGGVGRVCRRNGFVVLLVGFYHGFSLLFLLLGCVNSSVRKGFRGLSLSAMTDPGELSWGCGSMGIRPVGF